MNSNLSGSSGDLDAQKVAFITAENDGISARILAEIKEHIGSEQPVEIIDCSIYPSDHQRKTITEYMLQQIRNHRLHKNERQTILSHEDQLVVTQLCLAGINKETVGDFEVNSSKVIEFCKRLEDDKLGVCDMSLLPSSQADEYKTFRLKYDQYLETCNLMDTIDALYIFKAELDQNQIVAGAIQKNNFVVVNAPFSTVDKEILTILSSGKDLLCGKLATSLDMSICETSPVDMGEVVIEKTSLSEISKNPPSSSSQASVTEQYVEKVILSYLQLLVNTRNELALAHALNVPDRGLDHKAFTDLKHAAGEARNMSMYQTASSFVMRLRLGGKSYAPDMSSPLAQHIKGLAEFTDLMQKLQTVVEEEANTMSAVRRVLNIIKNCIVKAKNNHIRRESVETVTERLKEQAAKIFETNEEVCEESPARSAGAGGSLLGRKTTKIIRTLIDHYSCLSMAGHSIHVLSDCVSSQRTPLRFPSVLSKFRSPLESSPDAEETKSLARRVLEKQGKPKIKQPLVPRYKASMDWVDPNVNPLSEDIRITIEDYIPSKTIVQPGCQGREKGLVRKVLESINDQENADSLMHSSQVSQSSTKRAATEAPSVSMPPAKKAKKSKPKPKPATKKVPALQKGQKQLTSFFRV